MIGHTDVMSTHIKNLACTIERHAQILGLHVALTGGQLYKDGFRKDIDFVIYHENSEHTNGLTPEQREHNVEKLFEALHMEGWSNFNNYGRVTKCTHSGDSIDILYPEYTRLGEYVIEQLSGRQYSHRFPQTEDRSC